MQEWVIQVLNQFGYIGILLLIAIENIFPPIPSEIILTFGGFMTTYSHLNIWGVITAATAGSVLGAIALYEIGKLFKPERLERWMDGRWGHILHLKKGDVIRACGWFDRRGKSTVFFCRCVPIVRSLISIPAGMAQMEMGLFLLLTTVGSLIWNTTLVYLGVAAGASWENIIRYMNVYSIITVVLLGVIILIFCVIFFNKRFKSRNI
ncbi:MAG: DedA family protein [Caulobacteraceae bacterium]